MTTPTEPARCPHCDGMGRVPVSGRGGDGFDPCDVCTPAEPARWTVHRGYGVRHTGGDTLWCHTAEQGPSPALAHLVADALNAPAVSPEAQAVIDAAVAAYRDEDDLPEALADAVRTCAASIDAETTTDG